MGFAMLYKGKDLKLRCFECNHELKDRGNSPEISCKCGKGKITPILLEDAK